MEPQFFSCLPVNMLKGLEFSLEHQQTIVHKLFEHSIYKSYPPPMSYQLSFLKWYIAQVESHKYDVCDELYELYGNLISQPQPTNITHCFKSYFIGEKQYITLKESTNIISCGTTGLTTWQAAFHFIEWAMDNSHQFNQRHVLELGSGAGLVGLSICSMTTPSSYYLTDCHPHVLSLLSHNVHINFPDSDKIHVKKMDWNATDDVFITSHFQSIDYIIATDVIYDKTVIESFICVLALLLRHWPGVVAYVSSTIRNEETYKFFISNLDEKGIIKRRLNTESCNAIFHYDRSQHYEILQLHIKDE